MSLSPWVVCCTRLRPAACPQTRRVNLSSTPPAEHGCDMGRSRTTARALESGDDAMLGWALMFFVLAVIAGWLGFFGLAGIAAGIAKILFLIFLVLLVLSFLVRALRGQSVL